MHEYIICMCVCSSVYVSMCELTCVGTVCIHILLGSIRWPLWGIFRLSSLDAGKRTMWSPSHTRCTPHLFHPILILWHACSILHVYLFHVTPASPHIICFVIYEAKTALILFCNCFSDSIWFYTFISSHICFIPHKVMHQFRVIFVS